MGNYRFRLSDMIPNAWFYKLKDMRTKSRTHHYQQQQHQQQHHATGNNQTQKKHFQNSLSTPPLPSPRQSYYFSSDSREKLFGSPLNPKVSDTQFPDPPRKPRKKSHRKRRSVKTSSSSKHESSFVSAGCSCRATFDSVWQPEVMPDNNLNVVSGPPAIDPFDNIASWSSSCSCTVTSSATDLVIDMETKRSFNRNVEVLDDDFGSITELELPPILTKPPKFNDLILDLADGVAEPKMKFGNGAKLDEKIVRSSHNAHATHGSVSVKFTEEDKTPARRSISPASHGLRIRTYSKSPRLASKKIQAYNRRGSSTAKKKSLTESFAVVKSSFDPQKDFRDSMVEMIVENNIRASKDLEELLACYLSLNSNEYHDVIVKVFEQIWFDLTDIRL